MNIQLTRALKKGTRASRACYVDVKPTTHETSFFLWFFWDESGKELKKDQEIKQAILKKGVADAGSRTVPTVDGVRGTVGSDRSENRL
jgi:hypothetical protein